MAIDFFRPIPPDPSPGKFKPITLSNQFGDGYSQDASIGINSDMREHTLRWTNVSYSEASYIIDFLATRKGIAAFYWTPNQESAMKVFKCDSFDYTWKKGRRCDISATFKQKAAY